MKDIDKTREKITYELSALHKLALESEKADEKTGSFEFLIDKYSETLTAIVGISSQLISAKHFRETIDPILAELGSMTQASRVYLFRLNDNGTKMSNTHEWCAAGVTSQKENLQNLDTSIFPWWMEKLHKSETIHINDVEGMPDEASEERDILKQQGIKSVLVFPVFARGSLVGFIGFDNVKERSYWPEYSVLLLHLISEIIGSVIDRLHVEQDLAIRDQAINTSINAVVFADLNGRITSVNDSFLKLWKIDRVEEVVGKSVLEFWKSEREAADVMKMIEKEGSFTGDLVAQRNDGWAFDVHLAASVVKDVNGKPLCLMASFIDVTVRLRAEKMLMESEEKLYSIFQSATDAITVLDVDANITEANERAVELYGYGSKSEIIGRSFMHLIALRDQNKMVKNIRLASEEGKVRRLECLMVRRDGSEFLGEMNMTILKNTLGVQLGFVTVTRDITERRRIEKELFKLATTDELTGVLNRRSGLLLLKQQIQLAKRNKQTLCVCYVDIDMLKFVNDVFGHSEGDEVLKTVSVSIRDALRSIDVVSRIGGDEFLIVLPQCVMNQVQMIWKRVHDKIAAFNEQKTKPYTISLSHGCVEFNSMEEKTADQLITMADARMYEDKKGKSGVQ